MYVSNIPVQTSEQFVIALISREACMKIGIIRIFLSQSQKPPAYRFL